MDFRDPNTVGTFVYHCHLLEHEDGGMMGLIRVEPADSAATSRKKTPSPPEPGADVGPLNHQQLDKCLPRVHQSCRNLRVIGRALHDDSIQRRTLERIFTFS